MLQEISPRKSSGLDRTFFARDAVSVAKDLLGRVLVHERRDAATLYAKLQEVAAYEMGLESTSQGTRYQPGTISISTKYGKRLLDISTSKFNKSSCVTLIAGEIYDGRGFREIVRGPGNFTAALEIDKNYDGLMIDFPNSPVWIVGQGINEDEVLKRNKSNVPKNCKGYFYFKD